jgi:hypothetical protein
MKNFMAGGNGASGGSPTYQGSTSRKPTRTLVQRTRVRSVAVGGSRGPQRLALHRTHRLLSGRWKQQNLKNVKPTKLVLQYCN